MAVPCWLRQILDRYGISYEVHQHPPVFSASHLAQIEHISGYRVAKTVFLAVNGHPVAVVLPACARLDSQRVRDVVGNANLDFATEDQIASWFKGCQPGAVPPLRLRGDERILMDRSLAHLGQLLFPAGTSEDAVIVRFRDWYRAVRPGVGRFALPVNGEATPHGSPTILVVEDESDTNRLLCRLMEREGYACQGVEEGQQAVQMAAKVRPSAILLDLMLPDISGFEVCERLRQAGPLKRIPVVMVTALDDEASRQRGSQLGADAYLTKPFHPDDLIAEMHTLLADARA